MVFLHIQYIRPTIAERQDAITVNKIQPNAA